MLFLEYNEMWPKCNSSCTAVECSAGTYGDGVVCVKCPFGLYQDQYQQTSCKACPDGFTTKGTGSKSSQECGKQPEYNVFLCSRTHIHIARAYTYAHECPCAYTHAHYRTCRHNNKQTNKQTNKTQTSPLTQFFQSWKLYIKTCKTAQKRFLYTISTSLAPKNKLLTYLLWCYFLIFERYTYT